jgi:hypothetical protein
MVNLLTGAVQIELNLPSVLSLIMEEYTARVTVTALMDTIPAQVQSVMNIKALSASCPAFLPGIAERMLVRLSTLISPRKNSISISTISMESSEKNTVPLSRM